MNRAWIGSGYGWDETTRVATEHRCTPCGANLVRVGPASKAGSALLECPTCGLTAHLVPA